MVQVSKAELDAHVRRHSAVPDGFKVNGSLIQSKFYAKGVEVGRVSTDETGPIYEITEKEKTPCTRTPSSS